MFLSAFLLSGCGVFHGNWRYTVEAEGHIHVSIERVEPPQVLSRQTLNESY